MRLATVLRCVGCCWLKFDHFQTCTNNTQHVAKRYRHDMTCVRRFVRTESCSLAACCVPSSFRPKPTLLLKFSLRWPRLLCANYYYYFSISLSNCRNTVAKRTQHVAPKNVAICCVDMLYVVIVWQGLKTWIVDCGLRTADCGLRTADCGLRTADCGLRTADCGLRTADCGMRTAECGLRYKTRTTQYRLSIKHGLMYITQTAG